MSLKGSYSIYAPNRLSGMIRLWQFVLKNTNLMFSEKFDIVISDCYGQRPFYFRKLQLKAGQSFAFNVDTVDWQWCQDDFAAIIDSNNRIIKKWPFHLKEYGPGECPECHGMHKCKSCHGQGFVYPRNKIWEYRSCERCGGTGVCMTCNIPRRGPIAGLRPTGLKPF